MKRLGFAALAAGALALAGCNKEAAPADSAMTNDTATTPAAGELTEGAEAMGNGMSAANAGDMMGNGAETMNATDQGNTDHGNTDHGNTDH